MPRVHWLRWQGELQPAVRLCLIWCTLWQVSVEEVKPVRRQGEFLARHIAKFDEIVRDLNMPAPLPIDGAPLPVPRAALAGY